MRIRRFTARDMTEALRQVRESLGPEAVILETKRASSGSRGGNRVMVVAAVDRHPSSQPDGPPQFGRRHSPLWVDSEAAARRPKAPDSWEAPARRATASPRPQPSPALPAGPERPPEWEAEVARLRDRVTYLGRLVASDHFSTIPIPLREIYLRLIEAEVDSNLTFALLKDVAREQPLDVVTPPSLDGLRDRLLRLLPTATPLVSREGPQVALLVGPTGSGKTTAAAGLAALALRAGRRPALISADGFRAGGATGLRNYARILEVPFATAFEADALSQAAGRPDMADCDILLVDCPGSSPEDREALAWTVGLRDALADPQTHLVLSATAKVRDAAEACAYFAPAHPDALVFTKIDETKSYGGILSLALKNRLPVAYLGFGRNILDDLRPADAGLLVSLVLEPCAGALEDWRPPTERPGRAPVRSLSSSSGAAAPNRPHLKEVLR